MDRFHGKIRAQALPHLIGMLANLLVCRIGEQLGEPARLTRQPGYDFRRSWPRDPEHVGLGRRCGLVRPAANEGIARQPEAAADIRGGSIILAALIEGVSLFGVVVTLLIALG